ncbi:S9 family peptidase [Carboxylicivirga caseinilyticus]|uniref:S9 family peptidase n=1 Tax=Carboxylicivirga caseinilyticus TaxID=3417572 RepID=UPI003D32BCA5|nr:S9 family peptidase [Marinilabiliaceae bacterium A049]
MRKLFYLMIFLALPALVFAQKKTVTLDDFTTKGTFYARSVYGLTSMNDGIHFTTLEEGSKIEKYEYKSGKKVATILDLKSIDNCPVKYIDGYELNADETKVLFYTNSEKIYRHSFRADYYIYDLVHKELNPLSENGKQQVASFSPNGEMVAFVRENNLFLKKLKFGTESAITEDGEYNSIINGAPDWVYEEEFSFNKAYDWSPNSQEIAFIRFDESKVKEYSFPVYQGSNPTHEENALYPDQYRFKYPKAGEENATVSVHVFNIKNRTTKTMDIGDETDIYIPRVRFTYTEGKLGIMKFNRHQNQFDLMIANTASGICNTIFTDRNEYYIGEGVLDNLQFTEDNKYFVYVGEIDGYNHIHLYTMAGAKVAQVTKGEWDVTDYLGYDVNKKLFYYQAAAKSPLQREVYAISADGKKKIKFSDKEGTNSASFSKGFKYYINNFSNTTTPTLVTLHDGSGKLVRVLKDNADLKSRVEGYQLSPKEFFTFKTTEGVELNGWMVKPLNFDPNKEYPLLMVQYSGPNSQQVLDKWSIGWEQYLATEGYMVACVDPRGTGARGEEFRKCTYLNLGEIESHDQIEAAKYFGGLPYVDASRIGIWGWSYGGYMSAMCLSKSDVFKIGIAVAPVTSYRYYDSVYTERYMRTPKENPKGYENCPMNLAKDVKGRLFLIHGTADDNVHYQNTIEYVDRLVQAGIQFDMFSYTNRNHSIYGGNTRSHLYRMKADYILRNL